MGPLPALEEAGSAEHTFGIPGLHASCGLHRSDLEFPLWAHRDLIAGDSNMLNLNLTSQRQPLPTVWNPSFWSLLRHKQMYMCF